MDEGLHGRWQGEGDIFRGRGRRRVGEGRKIEIWPRGIGVIRDENFGEECIGDGVEGAQEGGEGTRVRVRVFWVRRRRSAVGSFDRF